MAKQENSKKGNKHATNTKRRERKARNYMKRIGNRVDINGEVVGSRADIRSKSSTLSPWHPKNVGHPNNSGFGRGQRRKDANMVNWLIEYAMKQEWDSSTVKRIEVAYRDLRKLSVPRQAARDAAIEKARQHQQELNDKENERRRQRELEREKKAQVLS
jgi:hypothetical protein